MESKRSSLTFSIDSILDNSKPSNKRRLDDISQTIKCYEAANPFQYPAYSNLSLVKYRFDKYYGKTYCSCYSCDSKIRSLSGSLSGESKCDCKTLQNKTSYDDAKVYSPTKYDVIYSPSKYDDVFADEEMAMSPESGKFFFFVTRNI